MDLRDALRMRPGDVVTFRTSNARLGLGLVRLVTPAGGVLIDEHDSHTTVSLDQERWVPFNRITNHLARRA